MTRSVQVSRAFHQKKIAAAVLMLASTLARAQAVAVTDGSTVNVGGNMSTTSNSLPGIGLYVTNGSTARGSAGISTAGSNAASVYAASGGTVQLNASTLVTTGANSSAVFAQGNQGQVTHVSIDRSTIQTAGDWATGAQANGNSNVVLQDSAVATSGQSAHGLYAIGQGANLTATGTTITTTGDHSVAAYHQAGGLMVLDNVSIATKGSDEQGVLIGSQGFVGDGVTSNVVQLSNSTINTQGNASAGLQASDNATLTGTNVKVTTSGTNSYGASATFGAQIQLDGASIATTGDGAAALRVAGMPATVGDPGNTPPSIAATGLEVSTAGQNAPVAALRSGANLSIANSTLIASGAGSDVVRATAFDTPAPAMASFAGSTLASAQGNGLSANGTRLDVTLNDSTLTAGANIMAADVNPNTPDTQDGGTLNVVANASTLTGTAYTGQASTLNATLQGGSTWNVTDASNVSSLTLDNGTVRYLAPAQLTAGAVTLGAGGGTFDTNGFDVMLNDPVSGAGAFSKTGAGTLTLSGSNTYAGNTIVNAGTLQAGSDTAFSPASAFTVSNGAALDLNGFNATLSGLANSGTVHFGATPGTVLTVAGNYAGNGGTLVMHTELGDSSSATDWLHVQGATSGNTNMQVVNAGGIGAQTTGNGILMVQVDGASNGTFAQAGKIEAGAFQYTLYKGGVGADGANGNWYLRSTLEVPPGESDSGEDQRQPSDGAGSGTSPAAGDAPLAYRPGAVGYAMAPQLAANYGFTMLGTLHQRVGDVPNAGEPSNTTAEGVWGRVNGASLQAGAMHRFSASSQSFFAQFGKDWTLTRGTDTGSTHAGVTLTLGAASADFADSARSLAGLGTATGSVSTQMQGVGGYWTRYLRDGSYADSVAQITRYHNQYGDINGNSPGQTGLGVVISEELGKPFQIAQLPIAFEPQAQLSYQYLHLNGFSDAVSAVSGTTTNALRGRIGFRLFGMDGATQWEAANVTPYLTANVQHDFLPQGQTVVGETPFNAGFSRTWFDIGLGVTATFKQHSQLHAAVNYLQRVDGQRMHGVIGNVGYRYRW